MPPSAARIRAAIVTLAARRPGGTICPSEVARSLDPACWRALMEPVREAARGLAREGTLVITRAGVPLSPELPFRGAIRLGLPTCGGEGSHAPG